MSYGEFDVEMMANHTRELARNISPNNPWEDLATRWIGIGTESIVVEVGGYHGMWAFRMAERYNPKLYIFEPQLWCIPIIKEVLKDYQPHIYPFALGKRSCDFAGFEHETDGFTFEVKEDRGWGHYTARMEDMKKVFKKEKLMDIDIMQMNAEGWEFVLIPYMFELNILPKVFMFQGHDQEREPAIRKLLATRYISLWDHGTALSAWSRNG